MKKKTKAKTGNGVNREALAKIAAAASCDPRTALAYLHGLSIRPLVRERIENALAMLGLEHLKPGAL